MKNGKWAFISHLSFFTSKKKCNSRCLQLQKSCVAQSRYPAKFGLEWRTVRSLESKILTRIARHGIAPRLFVRPFVCISPVLLCPVTPLLITNYWHCSRSVQQSLCNGTVSVRLSVRLSIQSVDRCLPLRRVCCCGNGGQKISVDRSSTALSSKCKQCHVVDWRRKLNTDLFDNENIQKSQNCRRNCSCHT